MSPRAILVFRPHVSSSGQTIKFATPVGNYPIWTLARRHGSHRGSHCSHRNIFSKESEIIGLLGRRCKTRLRGAPLFAKFVMICQQNRRGQRAPFLTRGSLLSPIVRSPLHITPVPPFLPFSFRPRTSPHKRQLHQSRLIAVIQPQFVSTKQDLTMPPIPIIAPQPRRLLPQPTIIDTSAPVLPINLDDPFICHTPAPKNAQLPRLMSPIRIHHRAKRSLASRSPTPCSSIKRQVVCPPRTPRRRRHNIRPEAIIAPRVINFDSLPWISALDDPVLTAGNPWDSDLSGLASAEYMRVSGLGPVRRRKSISRDRTEPLVPLVSRPSSATSTPPPRFPSPSRVQFVGLMPIMTPAQEATW